MDQEGSSISICQIVQGFKTVWSEIIILFRIKLQKNVKTDRLEIVTICPHICQSFEFYVKW